MCLPRGTVPAPSHLCRSGVLASPCSGALSPQTVLFVISAQVSAACGMVRRVHRRRAFRRVRGPEGIPAAAGRPQGSDFFRAWRAFGEQERRQNRLIFNRLARPKRVQFVHVLVQACDPALAILTVKNAEKVYSNRLFALPECLPRVSPSAVKLHIM